MLISPIVLFTYKKLEPLRRTLDALKNNPLSTRSQLFIFSDGPKNRADEKDVAQVRTFLKKIEGFEQVNVIESKQNKGLAKSIIEGVTEVLGQHESVIVLEDDLVTSANFLDFMNEGLVYYKQDPKVLSVSGYTVPMKIPNNYRYDIYFTQRASSWGWATWKDRWEQVDWEVSDYNEFAVDGKAKKKFNNMGSDMTGMLAEQMNGQISSWAVRFCYHQFRNDLYTVFPVVSKIANIGFGEMATHTKGAQSRFATVLDTSGKTSFSFDPRPSLNEIFVKQFTAAYSWGTRAFYKIKGILGL